MFLITYFMNIALMMLCFYGTYQLGRIRLGKARSVIFTTILLAQMSLFFFLGQVVFGWITALIAELIFDLFYDDEPFSVQAIYLLCLHAVLIVPLFIVIGKSVETMSATLTFAGSILELVMFLLLSGKRGYLNVQNTLAMTIVYILLIVGAAALFFKGDSLFADVKAAEAIKKAWWLLGIFSLFIQEMTLKGYQIGYDKSTERFQKDVLAQQYEEIKMIYTNMRGWRHDYHNHIQVLKAYMDEQNYEEARQYMEELEAELSHVDTYVRSGNLMCDAILNSKLTIAEKKGIRIDCKAILREQLEISDVDLCVILGNLLDNAIEACDKIERNQRFLRIYIAIMKQQIYISIQNAAKEDLDFKEQHYISTKRGNHGLGMKRVAVAVEKYQGYLNLNNEPGVFGAEVTLPLLNNSGT